MKTSGQDRPENLAIEQAHGKVIIFLDCDDLILEGLYSQGCKEFLQRAIDNDIEVIATARLLTDESAQTEELLTTPHNNEIFQERRLTETVETEDLYDDSKINEGFYPRVKESDLINPPAPDAQLVWSFRNGEHKRARAIGLFRTACTAERDHGKAGPDRKSQTAKPKRLGCIGVLKRRRLSPSTNGDKPELSKPPTPEGNGGLDGYRWRRSRFITAFLARQGSSITNLPTFQVVEHSSS